MYDFHLHSDYSMDSKSPMEKKWSILQLKRTLKVYALQII